MCKELCGEIMQIIKLFSIYFLILILSVSFVLIFLDSRNFIHCKEEASSKLSKTVGIVMTLGAVCLFLLNTFL